MMITRFLTTNLTAIVSHSDNFFCGFCVHILIEDFD